MAETKTQAAGTKQTGWLTKLFGFDPSSMKVSTEIIAGITTFLAMSYILAVNPSILADCGMDKNALFTTTAVASILATLVMAFYAKLPFALAPGMGLNAFFCYTVCLGMGYSWQFALTAVLIEGVIFVILTLTSVREAIVNALPLSLRKAIGAGIGLFIALIGLKGGGIVVEYFGYGFGFVGLTLFMMQQVAPGRHQMAHYAFASGIMNLSVMLTGAVSGYLSDWKGYGVFFIVVMLATIPAFVMTWFVPFTYDDKPTTK